MAAEFESVFGSPYPKELVDLQIFHKVTKAQAEEIVKNYNKGAGTYLLRPSEGGKDRFSITVSVSAGLSKAKICHLRVTFSQSVDRNGTRIEYFISKTPSFESIKRFLKHYSHKEISCEDGTKVTLQCGIGRQQKSIFRPPNFSSGRRYSQPELNRQRPPIGSSTVSRSSTGRTERRGYAQPLQSRLPARSASEKSVPVAACSAAAPSSSSFTPQSHFYKNVSPKEQKGNFDPRNRPPLPVPIVDEDETYVPAYFVVDTNRDFLQEHYEFLKEIEMCECGLQMKYASLPDEWAVHKTDNAIFFQHGVQETQWELPEEVAQRLTETQINFMTDLCHKQNFKVPNCVAQAQAALRACSEQQSSEEEGDVDGYEIPNAVFVKHPVPAPRRVSFNTASDKAVNVSATAGAPSGPHDTSRHS